MEMFFYSTPNDLKDIFTQLEDVCPIVYEPNFISACQVAELDELLHDSLISCKDFYNFGRVYPGTPGFWIYNPDKLVVGEGLPILLTFSGPPTFWADNYVICEGSLYLDSENKRVSDRTFYKNVKKFLLKHLKKVGYCYLSPEVYTKRHDYLFIQGNHDDVAPAWYLDHNDQPVPVDVNSWYQMQKRTAELYDVGKEFIFSFFASEDDYIDIFSELESEYNLGYIISNLPHKLGVDVITRRTIASVLEDGDGSNIIVFESKNRMFMHLCIGGYWNNNNTIINLSKVWNLSSLFGDGLYKRFISLLKQRFHAIDESHYGPLYLGPTIFRRRHEMILNLNDPRFRIDTQDKVIHVWRKEWDTIIGQTV